VDPYTDKKFLADYGLSAVDFKHTVLPIAIFGAKFRKTESLFSKLRDADLQEVQVVLNGTQFTKCTQALKHQSINRCDKGDVDAKLHITLTLALDGDDKSALRSSRFNSRVAKFGFHSRPEPYGLALLGIRLSCVASTSLNKLLRTELHGLSPRANYTDRGSAACRRTW
jgi:hypothetical protein